MESLVLVKSSKILGIFRMFYILCINLKFLSLALFFFFGKLM